MLDIAGGTPRSICDVGPDGDVRQLVLSQSGAVAAFTACQIRDQANQLAHVRSNLYVASTDGTTLTKITAAPVFEKFIEFALSGDGGTIVWVDDRAQGAWVADTDGSNAVRLPAPPSGQKIQAVFCNALGTTVYYQTSGAEGVKLHEIDRAQSTTVLRDQAPDGIYEVSYDGSQVYLLRMVPGEPRKRAWWHVSGASSTKVAEVSWPRHLGSWTWSADAATLVWCGGAQGGGLTTYVWRPTQP